MLTTITSKGQVTVPKSIREQLHLHPGDKIEFFLSENNQVWFIPVTGSIKRLKGMVPPPKKPVSIEDMNKAIRDRGK